jgi:hypothetical protein
MKKHQPDWTSGVFGIVFASIGIGLLFGNLRWTELNTKAFWAIAIVAAGVLVLGSALRPILDDRARSDGVR